MAITVFTLIWAAIALLSLIGLYFFNKKPSLMAFITKREYLLAFLVSSILGMREVYPVACIIFAATLLLMFKQYPSYVKNCMLFKPKNKKEMESESVYHHHRNL